MSDGFQMPPALAGDDSEVTPDAEGAKNFGKMVGGLTLAGLAASAAFYATGRIKSIAGVDEQSNVSLNIS